MLYSYRITFPVPLAEAASWDLEMIEKSARLAATEASAGGINWVFAPMVDIARDPRWGRIVEGAGEDPFLGSLVAAARVRGFQGHIGDLNSTLACAKHFAAYGGAQGGRDYDVVDISERSFMETYLPPFKAAVDSGVATIMSGLHEVNGIPSTANTQLIRTLLKIKWNFQGFLVSDWQAVQNLEDHGIAQNDVDAAQAALEAGVDMEMVSKCYRNNLEQLVQSGKVSQGLIDEAVWRILLKKAQLGLFEDPFKYLNKTRERHFWDSEESRVHARAMGRESIVLLKNEGNILPVSKTLKIALIGPLANDSRNMLGAWAVNWPTPAPIVSLFDALHTVLHENNLIYAEGCTINDTNISGFQEAVSVAKQADVVLLSMGEAKNMSGENNNRASLGLPGMQHKLIQEIYNTGKPIVMIIHAGRPLVLPWEYENIPAILYAWFLGSEAGNALADVLFRDYNPSGKLPISFPRAVGQIPVYYNRKNTGRPALISYFDLPITPQYPFGYGLSYTTFNYSNLVLSKTQMSSNERITVSLQLNNIGQYAGAQVVQMYLRDRVSSVTRPLKELKGFSRLFLKPGQMARIQFQITMESLSFYDKEFKWIAEPGYFDVSIGASSDDIRLSSSFLYSGLSSGCFPLKIVNIGILLLGFVTCYFVAI